MPAPAERPDDVLHRPDRRDDDAHLLRKPGPPHLRGPRDPHPQTARRRRRDEIGPKSIQRRDAENAEISAEKTKHKAGRLRFTAPSGSDLRLLLCAYLCDLCASALNLIPQTSSDPGGRDDTSKSSSAPPNSGKRNLNPAASAAAGSALWLASRISDISPNSNFSANTGTGKMAGRWRTLARVCVKSALLTGMGAAPLSGPLTSCSTANWNMAARSARWIQGNHCLPSPNLPPAPMRNGVSMRCSAPPRASSATPVRTRTTRIPNASAAMASFSHATQTSAG